MALPITGYWLYLLFVCTSYFVLRVIHGHVPCGMWLLLGADTRIDTTSPRCPLLQCQYKQVPYLSAPRASPVVYIIGEPL
jgi:hypothetical protein